MASIKPPSLSSILSKIKADSSDLKCVVCDIEPEAAQQLLDHYNNGNRPISKSQYSTYANEMLRGKWQLNGEAIIIGKDENGNECIISGQHRLLALIKANQDYALNPDKYPDATLLLHTVIVTGVDLVTADTVDLGMTRKHSHVLYRDEWVSSVIPEEWSNTNSRKVKWVNCLAGAARLVWLRAGGATVSSAPKFLVSEMLDFIKQEHSELCEFVSAALSANEEEGNGLKMSLPYIAALVYIASMDEDGEIVSEVKNKLLDSILSLAQGTGYAVGSAEHALASYWNKLSSTPGSKDRDLEIVGPFVKAMKAIISGDKITAAKIALTKKEAETYSVAPPLFDGWDTHCFINAAEVKSSLLTEMEAAKEAKETAKA